MVLSSEEEDEGLLAQQRGSRVMREIGDEYDDDEYEELEEEEVEEEVEEDEEGRSRSRRSRRPSSRQTPGRPQSLRGSRDAAVSSSNTSISLRQLQSGELHPSRGNTSVSPRHHMTLALPHSVSGQLPGNDPLSAIVSKADLFEEGPLLSSQTIERTGETLARLAALRYDMELFPSLPEMADIARGSVDAEHAHVFVVAEEDKLLVTVVPAASASAPSSLEFKRTPGRGLMGLAVVTRRMIQVDDAQADERHDRAMDSLLGHRARSLMLHPLVNAETSEVIGVLRLGRSSRADPFEPDEVRIATLVAGVLSGHVTNLMRAHDLAAEQRHDRALLKLAKELSSELDLQVLMSMVIDQARAMLRADRCTVLLADDRKRELFSFMADKTSTFRVPFGSGIAGCVAVDGVTLNIPDVYSDSRFNPEYDVATGYKTKSMLCGPIFGPKGAIVGVIQVLNRAEGSHFTAKDEQLLETFSRIAGIGLANSRLYETSLRERRKVASLLEVSTALSSELHIQQLISVIMQSARNILNADRCTLFLLDHDSGELVTRVAEGTQEIRIPATAGIAGHVASTGEVLNLEDAYSHPHFNPTVDRSTGYRTRSLLCVPIRNPTGVVTGVTQMINKKDASGAVVSFDHEDEDIMMAFSSQAAVAIENSMLFTRTESTRSHLDNILRSITNAVITLNEAGVLVSSNDNPVLDRILPFAPSELPKAKMTYQEWLGTNHPVLRLALDKFYREGVPSETYNTDFLPVAKRGAAAAAPAARGERASVSPSPASILSINFRVQPYVTSSGKSLGAILIVEDNTPQRSMRMALSAYLNSSVCELLLERGGARLGGEEIPCTVLFADMRGYTSYSEKMSAPAIVQTLNTYFGAMVPAILDNDGVVDKYIGDALMAVFGSPVPKVGDSVRACLGALAMVRNVAELNRARKQQGIEPLIQIGVGLSTGSVVSGNVGTERRLEFSVIGAPVNLASRLEGTTKQYGVSIMVSEATRIEVRDSFYLREVDFVCVKGTTKPTRIYELIEEKAAPGAKERHEPYLLSHVGALKSFRDRNFAEAMAKFKTLSEENPADKVFKLYVQRCEAFLATPPAPDWDGSFVLDEK